MRETMMDCEPFFFNKYDMLLLCDLFRDVSLQDFSLIHSSCCIKMLFLLPLQHTV